MVSFLGNITLWISLFFSIYQLIFSHKKINSGIIIGLFLSSLLSFLILMYAYIISDFSIVNVYQNSHTTKPILYKVSAVWGNHEGSMLLWILILTLFNFFLFKSFNQENLIFIGKALQTQALIIVGFIIFTIFTSNPFLKIEPRQIEGLGFNPILQDPALAIHPPLLYIGYVGLSAAFSLALATLSLKNSEKIQWHVYMKPFVMAAWSFLTIGISFGSIWAYYELGWGGWWFWDPVENASFMPWLIATALIHSLIIVEKKKSLQSWVLLLAILGFLLSVVGTFLVRSGILTSVHTFALDPSRGIYILTFTAFLGFYSLILYGLNSKKYFNNSYFSFISKEGAILSNNILMVIVCASVLLGTIYPLIVEAFTNNKISVGEPYYNSIVIPIIIPAILIMGLGPILSWGNENKSQVLKKIFPAISLTLLMTVLFFLIYKSYNLIGILGILLASWIISNNLIIIFKKNIKNFIKFNIPKCSYGMIISHLGIGLLILGITGSSVWQEEKIKRMKINDVTEIKNYKILFKEIKEVSKSNYVAIQGNFLITDNKKNIIAKLIPENRFYPITKIFTTEASIHTNLARDLYIVLGEGNTSDGWSVKVYYNPLVIWIWIGALTIFLGGITSFFNNLKIAKRLLI